MTNYAFIYDIINDVIILGMEESQIIIWLSCMVQS